MKAPRAIAVGGLFSLLAGQPALAAGNLTLPFNIPSPHVTSWTDHHYPDRQSDGLMVRFDGATGYAYDGHRGTDYAVAANTPVIAADDGTVIYSEWSDSGGWGIVIEHATNRTAYFHNNQLLVYPGQHVARGQLIALSGSTGNSTGPHVHFEVRDLQTPWHSIDPYGWTGKGPDPWSYDVGYLWTSNPPVPFVLPLAFLGGAHWNAWYGVDGPPPPVTWRLRDGGRGLGGYAAQWDADPGANAARTRALTGSAAVPGPGSHLLHLRLWDGGGRSADITYLYLYDVEPPTASASITPARTTATSVHWSAADSLAGVKDVSLEISDGAGGFRPWLEQSSPQPEAGEQRGAVRVLGDPGATYQLRLTIRDAARNAAPPVLLTTAIPAAAGPLPTPNDEAVLGVLPAAPDGAISSTGLRQEHPLPKGAVVLGSDASVTGLGGVRTAPLTAPASRAAAVDIATTNSGSLTLLADGTTWHGDGTAGPRLPGRAPVRLLATPNGALLTLDADGTMTLGLPGTVPQRIGLSSGITATDAGLFFGTIGGLILDSAGSLHSFGGADQAMSAAPAWTLPGQPRGLALGGTAEAPAGVLTDSNGDWQTFGSLLMLSDAIFGRPIFDPATGLPIR